MPAGGSGEHASEGTVLIFSLTATSRQSVTTTLTLKLCAHRAEPQADAATAHGSVICDVTDVPAPPENEERGLLSPADPNGEESPCTDTLTCIVCFDVLEAVKGLRCAGTPAGGPHILCSNCLERHLETLLGCVELQERQGGLACEALNCTHSHIPRPKRPTQFTRHEVEPHLNEQMRLRYREAITAITKQEPALRQQLTTPLLLDAILAALNPVCPACHRFVDPDPDGCIAMTCAHCNQGFCWLCFEHCGADAHDHAHRVHQTYFPNKDTVTSWHRHWRWARVDEVLRGVGDELKVEALELARCHLSDDAINLWPFPAAAPPIVKQNLVPGGAEQRAFEAAENGDVESLSQDLLLVDVNARGRRNGGRTMLMIAANAGHLAVIIQLLFAGADVCVRDANRASALSYAARRGFEDIVRELLDAGYAAGQSAPDDDGWTPLMHACSNGHTLAVARLLGPLSSSASINHAAAHHTLETALIIAVKRSRLDVVQAMLGSGRVDEQGLNACDRSGKDALQIACRRMWDRDGQAHLVLANKDIALALLEAGASVEPRGRTCNLTGNRFCNCPYCEIRELCSARTHERFARAQKEARDRELDDVMQLVRDQKQLETASPVQPSSGCGAYKLDLNGSFGHCMCGQPKAAHTPEAQGASTPRGRTISLVKATSPSSTAPADSAESTSGDAKGGSSKRSATVIGDHRISKAQETAASPVQPSSGCGAYKLDLNGSFGHCTCGQPKAAHTPEAQGASTPRGRTISLVKATSPSSTAPADSAESTSVRR